MTAHSLPQPTHALTPERLAGERALAFATILAYGIWLGEHGDREPIKASVETGGPPPEAGGWSFAELDELATTLRNWVLRLKEPAS